jgi:uncharacterized protein (DUF983 family)
MLRQHRRVSLAGDKSIWTGIKRGLTLRCPNCGEGRLFVRYVKVRGPCEACGTDNRIYPSDDFPPYLTILVTGHVLVPLFMWSDRAWEPSVWVQAAIWLPVTLLMCLALLPLMKGATIGLCWATDLVRSRSAT